MSEYHTMVHSLIVKPKAEPIYSEQATIVELADEAGGLFVSVKQSGKINPPGDNQVHITVEEWPAIREAIDRMIETAGLENGN